MIEWGGSGRRLDNAPTLQQATDIQIEYWNGVDTRILYMTATESWLREIEL